MQKATGRFAIIIPTIGRFDELRRMLQSLALQSHLPHQVVIVDEAGEGRTVATEFSQLNIFVTTFPKGSASAKRNRGLQYTTPETELIGFMDDDIVLAPEALEAIRDFWRTSPPELGGVSCNLVNHPPRQFSKLKSLGVASRLALYDNRPGAVLRSGFHTQLGCLTENHYVHWLPSTAVVYRRQILLEEAFDEWYQGYSYLEDLDFSYTVGRRYKLAVVALARFWHFPSQIGRSNMYLLGKKEVVNRLYFVRKHPELSTAWCVFALGSRAIMSLVLAISMLDGQSFRRAIGNFVAAVSSVRRGLWPVA